ncbi:MAG TPA: MFS transporter, partial [Candidatus Bilophila faecipullorum]|nr:MFS transporter [Candidatus Bilophila faecipullorum]
LSIEYSTALVIFTGYATTGSAWVAGILYILDYIVFNFSIALRTFFQKIAEPQDIAPTMAVAQTINHIAAVFVPVLGGWIWVEFGYQIPFFMGAALTCCSLALVQLIDREIQLNAVPKA